MQLVGYAQALGYLIHYHYSLMTLETLSDLAGIEYSQVIRVEGGKVNATISTIEAIAKGLGVSMAELFAFEVEKPS